VAPPDAGRIAALVGLEAHADVVAVSGVLELPDVEAADRRLHDGRHRGRVHAEAGSLLAVRQYAHLRQPELEALVQVDEALALAQRIHEAVGGPIELRELDVAAQAELELAFAGAAKELRGVEDARLHA